MTDDFANAAASASDSLWASWRRTQEANQPGLYPGDPDCRFAAQSSNHRCVDSFGSALRAGMSCHYEAAEQLRDQARKRQTREHYEQMAADAKAGL